MVPRWRYILVSDALIRELPPAEFEVVALRKVGQMRSEAPSQQVQMRILFALLYCGYLAFMPGPLGLSVPLTWVLRDLYGRRATLQREFAADAFAAKSCGAPLVVAALSHIAEFNGLQATGPMGAEVGASGNSHVAARLERLRAMQVSQPHRLE
jgi:hypothetical protein